MPQPSHTIRFHRRRSRRGFTMIEVMIASTIMVLASTVAMSSFIFVARTSKSIRTQIFMARDSLHVQRAMKEFATTAEKFVLSDGNVLQITQKDGTQSRLSYVTRDTGNVIIWDPVYGSDSDQEIMIEHVTPLNTNTPVFALESSQRSVRLRFRIGDRFGSHSNDGNSGVGYQSYVVDSLFARRNSAT